jgi:ABC-2 type transport system ATP-binding protein
MANTAELRRITKRYDSFVAVDALSLDIPEGGVFGLLGPNGAGKTSAIRMTLGITLPDEGEVWLFGRPFLRSHLRHIGYLPEENGLYRKMKVLDHLIFLARLKGLAESDSRRRALKWCERLALGAWTDKKVDKLSKGMQQKVQFIATLLHDPKLVVLDEPFSGLDPANALEMKNILLELHRHGKTILLSTHRMEQVERLCDSICLIDHGRAVLAGNLKQIKAGYGKNSVQLEYQGQDGFLENRELVESFNNYGQYVEVRLQPGADAQELLQLAAAGARITRFELVEPSLEEIFIATVKPGAEPSSSASAQEFHSREITHA